MFRPGSSTELASVGDDKQLLLWDTRVGKAPTARVRPRGEGEGMCEV